MSIDYYQIGISGRRRLLADSGFVRNDLRIWSHPDGREIGEGVAAALTDQAFFRFLKLDPNKEIALEAESDDQGSLHIDDGESK